MQPPTHPRDSDVKPIGGSELRDELQTARFSLQTEIIQRDWDSKGTTLILLN